MGRPRMAACAAFAAGAYLGLGRDFHLALALACCTAAAGAVVEAGAEALGAHAAAKNNAPTRMPNRGCNAYRAVIGVSNPDGFRPAVDR